VNPHDVLIALADEYWDGVLEAYPTTATLLGDRRFDDQIEDLSAESEERLQRGWSELGAKVEALDPSSLSADDQVTRDLLVTEVARTVEGLEQRLTEMASDQMDGVHTMLLTFAPQINAPTPENAEAIVARYRQVGTMLDQALARFRAGLDAGRPPARLTVERSINQIDKYLATSLDRDPFVNTDGPEGWDGEAAWRESLTGVTRDVIRPGLQRYREMLADELLPVGRPDDRCGLRWLDEGEALYTSMVHHHTTLDDLTPDEIHDLGLAEIERLQSEYAEVGARLLGNSEPAQIFERLRTDPELKYGSAEEIMDDARGCLSRAQEAMAEWFGRLPQAPCEIAAVPDFLAADAPGAYYVEPAADGSRPGTYFVNQWQAEEQNRYELASVAFHEAIPGHHLQLAIAGELDHLPRFQRFSFGNTAFVEGWALYAERLADEMGLYRNDVEYIGMLAGDSWRSARLVVDTGLHAKGWSRQQAIDFMVENVPVDRDGIEVEIDRYVAIPGQALSYKIGQLEIQRLRRKAEGDGSNGFDIKAFHDRALSSGSVSLPVLRTLLAT
jgi:uncharacterized protein (DUF885 family)